MWVDPGEYKAVGQVLAEVRKQAGVTQQALAKLLGKPQSFVSSYEVGQRRLDIVELERIAVALGVEPKSLTGRLHDRPQRQTGGH